MIGEGVAATGDKVGELWSAAVLLISLISYPRSLCGKHFDLRTQSTSAYITLRLSKLIIFQRGLVGFAASPVSYALVLYLYSNDTYPQHSSTSHILPQHTFLRLLQPRSEFLAVQKIFCRKTLQLQHIMASVDVQTSYVTAHLFNGRWYAHTITVRIAWSHDRFLSEDSEYPKDFYRVSHRFAPPKFSDFESSNPRRSPPAKVP